MRRRVLVLSGLLFGSGFCALVYQLAWMREFALVFGGSTAASGAVLAIFMGGIGLGNAVLGPRADASPNPLRFYAKLEVLIAIAAALSPFLIDGVRAVYILTGGRSELGLAGATTARLVLSTLVLALPTIAMGGTLPAMSRAVTSSGDASRKFIGLIYGMNTLGAVLGSVAATFVVLELLGIRQTLWLACALNLAVAAVAWRLSAAGDEAESVSTLPTESKPRGKKQRALKEVEPPPAAWIYFAAGTAGFAFFLMELVWFRMLGPILGGTTFTFGLILAIALAGIGVGGAAYASLNRWLPVTLTSLALTFALEALAIAAPFAIGDGIALQAAAIAAQEQPTFLSLVAGWASLVGLVIFPAALVSGVQFPLLIALLGRGREHVGKQVGTTFAWNTVGAIFGSLAGGFGLLPLMTAPGAWRFVVGVLTALAASSLVLESRRNPSLRRSIAPTLTAIAALVCIAMEGPTAVWRHSGIGAGRAQVPTEPNEVIDWQRAMRRSVAWEHEGVESGIALTDLGGYAFVVNGKVDGHAVGDAGTQILLGLLGAWLHPGAQSSLVIGMGTGETAGWLAEVEGMKAVDVVELEPAVDEVARQCAAVNHDVMSQDNVRVIYDDAREVLLTTPDRYDLIVSEPSNPYRAGIANLFTREFYEAASRRLNDDGIFIQWLQAYDIDRATVELVLRTLRSVYPQVEIWQSKPEDMLIVCRREQAASGYDATLLRDRLNQEPFRSGFAFGWRATDLEAVLARFVAGTGVADKLHQEAHGAINTDNRNLIEYGFARSLGREFLMSVEQLRADAIKSNTHQAALNDAGIRWDVVEAQRVVVLSLIDGKIRLPENPSQLANDVAEVLRHYWSGDMTAMVAAWQRQNRELLYPTELSFVCMGLASLGDVRVEEPLKRLEEFDAAEAEGIRALYQLQRDNAAGAADHLERLFLDLRKRPWVLQHVLELAFDLAAETAQRDSSQAARLHAAISKPFAAHVSEDGRKLCMIELSSIIGGEAAVQAIEQMEPHTPWDEGFLTYRAQIYVERRHPLAARAAEELRQFRLRRPR